MKFIYQGRKTFIKLVSIQTLTGHLIMTSSFVIAVISEKIEFSYVKISTYRGVVRHMF